MRYRLNLDLPVVIKAILDTVFLAAKTQTRKDAGVPILPPSARRGLSGSGIWALSAHSSSGGARSVWMAPICPNIENSASC